MGLKNYSTNPRTKRHSTAPCLMAPRKPNTIDAYWDETWNPVGGCVPISPGCVNCYAARDVGTLQASLGVPLYRDTTEFKGGRHLFNGTLRELPPEQHRHGPSPCVGKEHHSLCLARGCPR